MCSDVRYSFKNPGSITWKRSYSFKNFIRKIYIRVRIISFTMVTLENYTRCAMHPTTYHLNNIFTSSMDNTDGNLYEKYVSIYIIMLINKNIKKKSVHLVTNFLVILQEKRIKVREITKYVGKFNYLRKMQMNPQQESSDSDEEQEDRGEKHEYNCQCVKCSDKYGNLPLLIKVIEESEETDQKSKEVKVTKDDDDENNSTFNIDQPSTSGVITRVKKEMTCDVCDKKFTHKGDFNKHLRKHTGEQPYNCNICFKKFSHASNLSRHVKLHSGDKPFECTVCNKKFSRKDKLLSHQKSRYCRKKSK